MSDVQDSRGVADTMRRINDAWVGGRVDAMTPLLHAEIVMVVPGVGVRVRGRDAFLAGFRGFVESATLHAFRPDEYQIDVINHTAVVSFGYEMTYERTGERWRATGR